jgi:hypothetical protein
VRGTYGPVPPGAGEAPSRVRPNSERKNCPPPQGGGTQFKRPPLPYTIYMGPPPYGGRGTYKNPTEVASLTGLRPSRGKPVRDALGIPPPPPLRGEGRDRELRLSAALTGPALLPPPVGGRKEGRRPVRGTYGPVRAPNVLGVIRPNYERLPRQGRGRRPPLPYIWDPSRQGRGGPK